MEFFDLYDDNRRPLGKTIERGEKPGPGENRMVIHVSIFNSKGELLIQQRQSSKRNWPDLWDVSVGGCVVAGETSQMGAERELFEELGISSDEKSLKKLLRLKRRNSWLDVWYIECDTPAEKLTLQATEVAEAKWVDNSELNRMIESGEFHNYGKEYFTSVLEKIDSYRAALV
jgi:isopentenyldiphosphate isomerase